MKRVLVVAPHPDDETLGCGGTLLKHKDNGDLLYWLIVTSSKKSSKGICSKIKKRQSEIKQVSDAYGFSQTIELNLPTTLLDTIPKSEIIKLFSDCFTSICADIIYMPFRLDAHSDHEVVFDATIACCKSFRNSFVRKVCCYETLSETNFGMRPEDNVFKPNYFVDISEYFDEKINIMKIYDSEILKHPFPRSEESLRSLAILRGSFAGCNYAESYMTLQEFWL